MAALVQVLALDQRAQRQVHARSQLVREAQADLAAVVHLGTDRAAAVQLVDGTQTELGVAGAGRPADRHAGLQLRVHLLVDRAVDLVRVDQVGGQREALRLVASRRVRVGDLAVGVVEADLQACQVSLVAVFFLVGSEFSGSEKDANKRRSLYTKSPQRK